MENEISPSSSRGFLSTRLLEEIWFPSCFGVGPVCERRQDGVDVSLLPAHLSDLLYLCPSLPDERATLAGRDNQPQGNWWLGADGAVGHQRRQILKGEKWKQRGGKKAR